MGWRKGLVAFMVASLLAIAGAAKLTIRESTQLEILIPIPEDFTSVGLACDSAQLVLFGHNRPFLSRSTDATVLRWTQGQPEWEVSYSQAGSRFHAWDVAADGSITALVSSVGNSSDLLRSSDHGRSWNRLGEVPGQVFGTAFFDALNGFAWGSEVAYSTEDGGATWSGKRVVDVFQQGAPWPVVDRRKRLWVASRRIDRADVSYWLTSFGANLEEQAEVAIPDRVARMVATGNGLWLLAQQGGYGKAMISKLEEEDSQRIVPIFELTDDLPLGFAVRDSRIAVVLSDTSEFDSSRYVLASDGQQSVAEWQKFTLGSSDSLQLVCLDDSGRLWAVGQRWLWSSSLKR